MNALDFLLLLIVAGICGSVAQALVGYSHGGCLTSIILGFIGALLGTYLARSLGLKEYLMISFGSEPGTGFPVVWSVLGATIFVAILSFFLRGRPLE